ncbi:M23 family metallopeptidase [Ideonella livida]|uniref:M23 family metallopeptidase n=1 Tax=Ideonella livida TaxID=2707176 RepID=A0A7C9PI78_9BURK|nr:M23 family metallopeptidase [Ideonella livida]NDY92637.1 M23 family metallopeptidase [Ideonella livida]
MTSLGPVQDISTPGHSLARLQDWLSRHRRQVSAAGLALLAGYGITAFGIAPLAPDAAELPQRLVVEAVAPEAAEPQLEALASSSLRLFRTEVTRSQDSLDGLLRRLGVTDPQAIATLRRDEDLRRLAEGRAGRLVQAEVDRHGQPHSLVVRAPLTDTPDRFERLQLHRETDGSWHRELSTGTLQASVRLGSGTIQSSLFAATDASGLPDKVASQLAELFAADIDFHRELRKGDRFSVVYESLSADGEPAPWAQGAGRVLAAEFVNKGRQVQAVWFGEGNRGAYYDLQGESKRRTFLASPMEFTRVTSGFAMRFHPILQTWRAHLGTDYGAPTGTPVRSVGQGVVSFSGQQGGYGNVVMVDHGNQRTTLYAHLSRIDVKKGQRVDQGQRVGAVGATGWATGPHLHFEVRVNGKHQDPLKFARQSETLKLEASQKNRFQDLARQRQAELALAAQVDGGATRFE